MTIITSIESLTTSHFGAEWRVLSHRDCSGRRRAEILEGEERSVFAKYTNAPNALDKAIAEANALRQMALILGVRTPTVIGATGTQESAVLVLEAVQAQSPVSTDWEEVAVMIASLHRSTDNEFGFMYDNFIGDFAQSNPRTKSWNWFYAEARIAPMLRRLEAYGIAESGEISLLWDVLERIDEISTESISPALLHGDLWPGNALFDVSGPILIDPAISYGNREMDLAFSQMSPHLSFPPSFYAQYQEIFPLPYGHEYRRELWQLWPLLAHVLQDGRKWMPQLLAAASKYQ